MRTNIERDDALIAEALALTGLSSKRATVEKALRDLVDHYRRKNAIEALRGIGWDGDLDEMRSGWQARDWGLEEPK